MIAELGYKDHAFQRTAERQLAPQDSYYVRKHGTRIMQAGGTVKRVLKYTNLPSSDRRTHARLVGWIVVLSADEHEMITSYRCEGRCSDASASCECWGAFRRRRLQLMK